MISPKGQNRVNFHLNKTLNYINNLKVLETKKTTPSIQKRINSLKIRISNSRKKLVFLSTRARDKITKFYASNALKEISQKLIEGKN